MRDPAHAILDNPWDYRIAELRYVVGTSDDEGFIDLLLSKEADLRRLRFWSPRMFAFEARFEPGSYIGMQIFDVSARQMENVGVEVSTSENTAGFRFFARAVEAV